MLRIHEQPMKCPSCGHKCILDECMVDCDGDGSFGCPIPDCGAVMQITEAS